MTEIEAKKEIEQNVFCNTDNFEMTISKECYKTIINALKKQIPKKATLEGDGYAPDGTFVWDEWICPCCEKRYEVDYDDYDFCPNCGQKIDWSDEK